MTGIDPAPLEMVRKTHLAKEMAMSSFEWICPFCNRHATITEHNQSTGAADIQADNFDRTKRIMGIYTRCPNDKCHKYTLRVVTGDSVWERGHARIEKPKSWQLIPESNAKPFPEYIPEPIRKDYEEACLIKDKSPKASATLSRRCLQGMIRDFHQIKQNNLFKAINALQQRVDPAVWKAIDAVRKVGNIGAHMEKDINLIIDVDPEEAELLIGLIERLLQEWYIARHERQKQMNEILELAKKKESVRKTEGENSQGASS